MTREEAIGILNETQVVYFAPNGKKKVQEALDMAIESLKADVARWSSWNKTFEQSGIADLISRADVHKTLNLLATEGGADAKMLLMDAHEFIDALPSADIVRCKDCYHYGMGNCYMYGGQMNEDDYCSRGARMEADNDRENNI